MDSKRLGKAGEDAAASWLSRQGYLVVERNWRYRGGELDLIFRDGEVLVIAEVRTRRSQRLGTAAESVDRRKQVQVRRTAEAYLASRRWPAGRIRFDVIAVTWDGRQGIQIEHYPGAF